MCYCVSSELPAMIKCRLTIFGISRPKMNNIKYQNFEIQVLKSEFVFRISGFLGMIGLTD